MNRTLSFSPLIVKEGRALLPLWAGTLVMLGAAFALHRRAYSDLALIGYIAGVVSLGAHSIGHEYGYRMVPMLLVQPAPRRRLLAAKLLIVGSMLATLALPASIVFTSDRFRGNDGVATLVLPMLAAIFTAPLLTMLCRNTLAGAVLGVSGPMTLWVATIFVAWWGFGVDSNTVTMWFLNRWAVIATMACPILAVLSWRTFNRMEALEGTPAALTLPRWFAGRAGVRRAAPWRALLTKELHLQQMTIAITAVYGVFWVTGMAVQRYVPSMQLLPLEAVLLLYCMGLAIVIGALASAEERQLGTHEAQLLQPVGAVSQWIAKCAVAFGLALLLGVVVPAVLIALVSPQRGPSAMRTEISIAVALLAVVLTASSLWISSLTSSGVKAMAWALPVGVGAAVFIQTVQTTVASASAQLGTPVPADYTEASVIASRVLPLLVVPALLWFGYLNHRSGERSAVRVISQMAAIALLIVTSIVIAGALV